MFRCHVPVMTLASLLFGVQHCFGCLSGIPFKPHRGPPDLCPGDGLFVDGQLRFLRRNRRRGRIVPCFLMGTSLREVSGEGEVRC